VQRHVEGASLLCTTAHLPVEGQPPLNHAQLQQQPPILGIRTSHTPRSLTHSPAGCRSSPAGSSQEQGRSGPGEAVPPVY
jgi:hypothetical protein